MGFSVGSYAKIWSAVNQGNYSIANVSVSKRNKTTEKYETEFQDSFVRLVGSAHTAIGDVEIPENGLTIKISSCDVTNKYDPDKERLYTNYVIFGFEIPDNDSGTEKKSSKKTASKSKTKTKAKAEEETDDDGDLPF